MVSKEEEINLENMPALRTLGDSKRRENRNKNKEIIKEVNKAIDQSVVILSKRNPKGKEYSDVLRLTKLLLSRGYR